MVQAINNPLNEQPNRSRPDIHKLLIQLSSDSGRLRGRAREQLADLGPSVVPALLATFNHSNEQAKWEAAKTLVEIGDPSVVSVLVKALEDEHGEIRWLAAEGLIAIGREAIPPLLQALIEHSDSVWLRRRAHQILQTLARGDLADVLSPVLRAMEDVEPVLQVPVAAHVALTRLM